MRPRVSRFRSILSQYIANCRRKNIYFGLTDDEFFTLIKTPCYYCGKKPSNVLKGHVYSGIDRLDNKRGYLSKNCVACCSDCNALKGSKLTPEETLAAVAAVKRIRSKK